MKTGITDVEKMPILNEKTKMLTGFAGTTKKE